MRAVFVYRKIIMTVFALVALFAIVKPCFNKVCILAFRAMGEYLAHWVFALFMIDLGILAYVLLFNNARICSQLGHPDSSSLPLNSRKIAEVSVKIVPLILKYQQAM